MIVTCPNCATRLQLDETKIPTRPFTVRCPKCQQIINAEPLSASGDNSALAINGDLPTSSRMQREATTAPAPLFNGKLPAERQDEDETPQPPATPDMPDLARMLAALLQRGAAGGDDANGIRHRSPWDRRRALVCVSTSHGGEVARGLAASEYEVFVASDARQAVERMRESKIEVLVLDSEFDMSAQGAAQISGEINMRRPAERRRMVVVHLSPSVRTSDVQAAFFANVNLVVNTGDVAELPRALDRTIHDLNELYKDFNKAVGAAEL